MIRRKRFNIYKARWHLAATFLFATLPLVFLFIFSGVVHIEKTMLFADLAVSVVRLVVAYVIAVVLAWIAAILFYRGKRASIALPFFDVLQSIPTFAAIPLAILYFGRNDATIIFFLVLAIIWPVLFSLISSLKLVKAEWEEAATMAGLHGWDYIKKFVFPVSIPGLITGSIIGLGDGWEALIATEIIVGGRNGLGSFFQTHSASPTVTAFGIFGLLLIIFSINKLIWLPLLERAHRGFEE